MSRPPELDAATGELHLAGPTFAALAAYVRDPDPERGVDGETAWQIEWLRQAGVLDEEGRSHPALAETIAAIRAPLATLDLAYARRAMRGWLDRTAAALLLPPGEDGRHKLTGVPRSWLPEALARLVDLGPRPRPEPARPVPYAEGSFPGVRRHWRLCFRPATDGGDSSAGTALEVVDTEGGLWIIAPGRDETLVGWPSTPTTVWRLFTRLVVRSGG